MIGLGRLGKALGRLFIARHLGQIQAIHSIRRTNVVEFTSEIGQGQVYEDVLEMPHAAMTIITTPDDNIEEVAHRLSKNPFLKQGDIVIHCSGVLSSNILASMRERGCFIASVHPLKSFTHTIVNQNDCLGTYCAIEGDEGAIKPLEVIFKGLGFIPFIIESDKKVLYHSGAVFASNYLVTLLHEAINGMKKAGVNHQMAKELVLSLMQGTLNNLKQQEAADALTGPLARGDVETIASHLTQLGSSKSLYQALAMATLPLTNHSEETLRQLAKLFSDLKAL